MSVTVADCLKLKSLSGSKVVAGAESLNNVVVSVSVLEYAVPEALNGDFFKNNEIVITGFISIKDDVEAQCKTLRRLHEVGEVGIILYYVGLYLPRIDEKLIRIADELKFPIICMPERQANLRYSEVICDVMEAIFKDQMQETYFASELLERISRLQNRKRTMENVLRMISDRIRCTIILTDRVFNILEYAAWPMSSTLHIQEFVEYYKQNPDFMTKSGLLKFKENENNFYVRCQTVMNKGIPNFNLIIAGEGLEIPYDSCKQAAHVVNLFINIWSNNEGSEGSFELIRSIINDEPVKMRRLAEIMHMDVSSIHIMWIISQKKDINVHNQEMKNTEIMINVRQFLKEQHRIAIVDIFEENVIAFMDNPSFADEINSLADMFMKKLKDESKEGILGLSTNLQNTTEVREAYQLFKEHIDKARIIFPCKEILTYHEILFASNCYNIISKGEEAVNKSLQPLKPLYHDNKEQDKELINTLSVFMLDAETNMAKTAELLFIHKSTVKYRIHKINEGLNYNVLKLPESYKIYTALAIERLLEKLEK